MLSQSDNWLMIDWLIPMIWEPGMIIKAWNQKDMFYWKRTQRQFPPCCWFCWHSRAIQHSVWEKVFYHWVFSTEFASSCKLIFFWLRKKTSFEDVNRHIIYVEVFRAVTLWYFDVIRLEGNFQAAKNYTWTALSFGQRIKQEWNVCIHTQSIQYLITFSNTQNPDFTGQSL